MKKNYNTPDVKIAYIDSADCIATSEETVGIGFSENDNVFDVSAWG